MWPQMRRRVMVGRGCEFHLNAGEAGAKRFLFGSGEMQCLGFGIIKEGILPHFAGQRRAVDEVRVEEQRLYVVCLGRFAFYRHGLSRGDTYHRTFLIVVFAAPIAEHTTLTVLYEDGIQAVVDADMVEHCGSVLEP